MAEKCYITLGKAGDVLNMLPLLRTLDTPTAPVKFCVGKDYASILEGVSYVSPVVYPGPHYEIAKAVAMVKELGYEPVCTQINGPVAEVREFTYLPAGQGEGIRTTSFQKESWRIAGLLNLWDEQAPLLFDRRDKQREAKMVEAYKPKKKLVLFYAAGASSPFPHADLMWDLVNLAYHKTDGYEVIDLATINAERFYDLLGLYERAHCLISTDSAPLHLARACPRLPVFAFANDKPLLWQGSPWRPNHVFYCRYGDFLTRLREFVSCLLVIPPHQPAGPNAVAHVYNAYHPSKRHMNGKAKWVLTPVTLGACGRDSQNALGDEKRVPFLRDALRMGMQRVGESDYVCLSRPDVAIKVECFDGADACFAYRIERKGDTETFVPVGDMFTATKRWWREHLPEIPDLLLGNDIFWGQCLAAIFTKHKAIDVTGYVVKETA